MKVKKRIITKEKLIILLLLLIILIFVMIFVLPIAYKYGASLGETEVKEWLNQPSSAKTLPSYCGNDICESDESFASCPQDCKINEIERIAKEYYKTHTYTLNDFYVCSDMAMDVWNLIRTKGINAKLCAGNIESDIFEDTDYFAILNAMNHAWVLAEVEPFAYIAVESTGGFTSREDKYYQSGICFENPKKLKDFLELRKGYISICGEYNQMVEIFNKNIANTGFFESLVNTKEFANFEGKMELRKKECDEITNKLRPYMD